MKYLFKSQNGFSLVQGMIVASVLAGSGLVANKLLSEQKLAQKSAETRDQIDDLHNLVYSALQNRENCEATVTGLNLGPALVSGMNPVIPEVRTFIPPSSFNTLVRVHGGNPDNVYMNGNVIIESMQVVYPTAEQGVARIDIGYERLSSDASKRTKTGYGAKDIKKSVKIRVQRNVLSTDPVKPFKSCYAVTDLKNTGSSETGNDISKQLCLEMNNNVTGDGQTAGVAMFVWDEANSTCIPNAKCPDHMIYTGVDSTGDVKCRLLSEWADFGTMIQPTSGTCGPNTQARLEVTQTSPVKFRIRCGP